MALLLALAPAAQAAQWSPPDVVSNTEAASSQVVMDARGNTLAVWGISRPDRGEIGYSWRPPRGAWTPTRTLPGGIFDVALSPLGEARLARVTLTGVVIATARPGGPFRDDATFQRDGRYPNSMPVIAVDDAGETAVAWTDDAIGQPSSDENGNVVFPPEDGNALVALSRADGGFREPPTVLDTRAAGGIDLAMNPKGNALVTWRQRDSGWQASLREPSGRFGPAHPLPSRGRSVFSGTFTTIAQDGTAFALSTEGSAPRRPGAPPDSSDPRAVLSLRAPLGGWSEPAPVATGSIAAAITVEPSGGIAVLGRGQDDVATFSERLPDGTVTGPVAISGPGAYPTELTRDYRGSMLAAWVRSGRVAVAERPLGGAFGEEVALGAESSSQPDVALSDIGSAALTWTRVTEGRSVVEVAVREDPALAPLPFPPDVDIEAPKSARLGAKGALKIPVRCTQQCTVRASGVLRRAGRFATVAKPGPARKLQAKRRGGVRVPFGAAAARTRKGTVIVSVTAQGRSPRPVTFSRRIRLR